MPKTTTLNLRVDPTLKNNAESILSQLDIPMSTAIDIYLKQIMLIGGIPFDVTLTKVPISVNMYLMSNETIKSALKAGYEDYYQGKVQDVSMAFAKFRKEHE